MEHDKANEDSTLLESEDIKTTQKDEPEKKLRNPPESLARIFLDAIEFHPSIFGIGIDLSSLFRGTSKASHHQESYDYISEPTKSAEERKIEIVKQLLESDIDPGMFDVLLQNEVDRRLKVQFGVTFLILTFLFTTASYAIIILDSIFQWNISEVAITALIIETPIQFIGLLYIIARNLFPQYNNSASISSFHEHQK